MLKIIVLFAVLGHAALFVQEPALSEQGGTATVSFSISEPADVEAAVLDSAGKVVRHLAAGVLGGESPPPRPLADGLSQSLSWDGLDDYGNPILTGPFRVRVRVGVLPRFEKRIHIKDDAMIPAATFKAWNPLPPNTGWGPDTVVDTGEVITLSSAVLYTGGYLNATTGLGLWDGGIAMIDMCVSKETDEIVFQHATWTGGSPTLLLIDGITGVRKKKWTQSGGFGEPVMDWFGRFYLRDRGYNPCSPDLSRFSLSGLPMNYSWGSNLIDVPTYQNDGIRQEGFCNDQYGNIYQAHYPQDSAQKSHYYVSKWDSVGNLLHDSLITTLTAMQGIRVDLNGNLFINAKLKPVGDTVPPEVRGLLSGAWNQIAPYSQAAVADEAYGSIIKFGPGGGSMSFDPAGGYYKQTLWFGKSYNSAINRISVNGAEWIHYGASFVFNKIPASNLTMCCCYNPRFDVDRFGRVIFPNQFNNDFRALDNNGNLIFRVHNRDLYPDVHVGSVVNVQATDRGLYLGDHINNQIIVMTWAADDERVLDVVSTAAERRSLTPKPLAIEACPNPFSRAAALSVWNAGGLADAKLLVYDMAGRLVANLTGALRRGNGRVRWTGAGASGKRVPNGFYCLRLSADGRTASKIVLLLK